MGSYAKIYYRKYNPEQSVALTWDLGYKNVTLLDGKRVVHHWDQPTDFVNGTFVQDEKLGQIKIGFTSTRPLQLELKINGKTYKPRKKGIEEVSVKGPITVFWIMFAFTAFLTIYWASINIAYSSFNLYQVTVGIFSFITAIYLFSALMLTFKKYWAFFVGAGYMLLSTFWYVYVLIQATDATILFIVLFRVIMLVFLAFSVKSVLYAIKSKKSPSQYEDILDKPVD